MEEKVSGLEGWLDIRWEYIPSLDDKISECEFFLGLASNESDVNKFRWLISAFLNAAYSYFDIKALGVYQSLVDPESGEPVCDHQAFNILSNYIDIKQPDKKYPSYIKTSGKYEITKALYEIRKKNTHYGAMTIAPMGVLSLKTLSF